MSRTLLRNGTVLTMDPDIGRLEHGDVLLEDDRIAAVDREVKAPDAEVIDVSNHVVLPGLVNTHAHLFQTGVRGIAADWTLDDYFERMLGSLRPQFEPHDVYLGDLFGAFEQLNAGVTTVLDWCHVVNTPAHADRAVDALRESGIRAVYAYGPPGIDIEEWYGDSDHPHPDDVRRLQEEYLGPDDDRVSLAMAIRGPDLSTYEVTHHDIQMAREMGLIASMHIGAAAYEGPGDHGVRRMAEDGLLGPDVNFVHANLLSDDLYRVIADAGVSVSATPEVEMQMGHGFPVTGDVLAAGGRLGLGSDIVSSIGSDMFRQMRFALQTQRALDNADALERGTPLDSLKVSARAILEAATIEGARALGLGEETGSLTPGKAADVIAIRTDEVNTFPVHDPISTVVLHAEPANVDHVYVAGELRKADGVLLDPQFDERRAELYESGRRLLQDAGLV